jgi:thiol-disulfide isomerase/thioredoxin
MNIRQVCLMRFLGIALLLMFALPIHLEAASKVVPLWENGYPKIKDSVLYFTWKPQTHAQYELWMSGSKIESTHGNTSFIPLPETAGSYLFWVTVIPKKGERQFLPPYDLTVSQKGTKFSYTLVPVASSAYEVSGDMIYRRGNAPQASTGQNGGASPTKKNLATGRIEPVGDDKFMSLVKSADQPVVAFFTATWCGYCRRMAPSMKALAIEYKNKVAFVGIDIDQSPEAASLFQVSGVPHTVMFKGGKAVGVLPGYVEKTEAKAFIEEYRR